MISSYIATGNHTVIHVKGVPACCGRRL